MDDAPQAVPGSGSVAAARQPFRFTLRTLFGVLTLVGLWMGLTSLLTRIDPAAPKSLLALVAGEPSLLFALAYWCLRQRERIGFWTFSVSALFYIAILLAAALVQ